MPMVPELPITMLACARLGIIHSQVFSGFSGKACADRIVDSESRILVTMDGYYRGGKLLDHKANADIALTEAAKDGYAAAFSIERRPVARSDSMMALPRFIVTDSDRGDRFEKLLSE